MWNLVLLQAGDREEWERAHPRLWELGLGAALRALPPRLAPHAENVVADALSKLQLHAIHRCRTPEALPAFFCKIVRRMCLALIKRAWAKYELPDEGFPDGTDAPGAQDRGAAIRFFERRSALLHLRPEDIDPILNRLPEKLGLDLLERAMFLYHIAGRMTQQEFAAEFAVALGSVSRLKKAVMEKMRRFLEGR